RAVHELEVLVEERLHAEGEAADAERLQAAEVRRRGVLRVHLQRDLRQRARVEAFFDGGDEAGHVFQRQERRGAAAEVERLDRLPTAELAAVRLDLHLQRADERTRVALRRDEVEVAVHAALLAEGDVDVEAGQGGTIQEEGEPSIEPQPPPPTRAPAPSKIPKRTPEMPERRTEAAEREGNMPQRQTNVLQRQAKAPERRTQT